MNKTTTLEVMDAQRMTSLEIAKVTGRQHKDVMRAIRTMEPAWEKTAGRKFALSEYRDKSGRMLPCYCLNKTECLYIATKFNDEARARLVLRWKELEESLVRPQRMGNLPQALLETADVLLQHSDAIRREMIEEENADTDDCMTISEIAKMFNTTPKALNKLLVYNFVQYYNGGRYRLTPDYIGLGLAKERTYHYYSLEGEKKQRSYLVWTREGVELIKKII